MDDGLGPIVGLLMVFILGAFVGYGVTWGPAYRDGQADAISGNYHYMVTYKPDGGAEWIELEKPTTQPVITRAK